MKKFFLFALVLITTLLISCDSKRVFEQNDSIDNETWNLKKSYTYQFDIPDSMQWFNMYLNVRNTTDYKYSNLFLFVTTTFPKGQIAKDTVECPLADNKGNWAGKGNSKYKDCRIMFKPKFRFSQSGKYQVKIEHGMREQDVKGISEIGIRLEKYN